MNAAAHKHLSARDPVMRRLIREHGKCALAPETRRSPFQSLVQAVAHQQLNGTAANTILARFKKLFPEPEISAPGRFGERHGRSKSAPADFPLPKSKPSATSRKRRLTGVVPSSRQIVKLSDDEIIARLTEVRGVGRWTVEMLLIFQLGRPDVLPADDFGVRTGFRHRLQKARPAQAEGTARASANAGVRIAPRPRGISGAAARRGEEKEVTPRPDLVIKFPLGGNSQNF